MIEHSPRIIALANALHGVQGMVDSVRRDATNPEYQNRYASLAAVIEAARPALQAHGLAFTQAPGQLINGAIEITTMITHRSGQWLRSTLHVPVSKRDAQGVGSAITYGCRYSLMATLGLPPVDDDGNGACGRAHPAREAPHAAACGDGSDRESFELLAEARAALLGCARPEQVAEWFRGQTPRLRARGRHKGTAVYDELVELCKQRQAELLAGSPEPRGPDHSPPNAAAGSASAACPEPLVA